MPSNSLSSKHICVVEDNDALRTALVDVLRLRGFRASGFVNGLAALAVLDETEFDLILSDIEMPEMTGIELLNCIQERGLQLPVMLMSAGFPSWHKVRERNGVAFLGKPFDLEELMARMSELFH